MELLSTISVTPRPRRQKLILVVWLLWIVVGWVSLIAAIAAGSRYGVTLRKWLWVESPTIRFTGDIQNGYAQGNRVYESAERLAEAGHHELTWRDFFSAYLSDYADVVEQTQNGNYGLDYTPARLMVMSLWVKHLRESNPPVFGWNEDYAITAPLLNFNTICEAVSAVAMILLVRHWRRARFGGSIWPHWRHPWREWPAVLAGLAVWFNAALLVDAHVWPQWDVWLVPFFLLGVLAVSKDWWLLAGLIVMVGAMLKGQVLMIFPVLLLWPIFAGKPLAAVRLLIGAAMLSALTVLPWMAYTVTAQIWLICMLSASIICSLAIGWRKRFDWASRFTALFTAIVIACVMVRPDYPIMYALGGVLIVLTAIVPRWLPRRWLLPMIGLQMSLAVFLAGLAFGGQFAWFEVGYVYPQHHYFRLVQSGSNLATILAGYRWRLTEIVSIPWLPEVTMRSFLISLYVMTLVLCGIGAAIHARRRSPRLLIAVAAPWVLFFSLMPQMHERYLVWAAVMMCAGMGISVGQTLLSLLVTFFAWVNIIGPLLNRDSDLLPTTTALVRGMTPGGAWGLLMVAAICLYSAMVPERKTVMRQIEPVLEPAPSGSFSLWEKVRMRAFGKGRNSQVALT